jgi:hypothetical protein
MLTFQPKKGEGKKNPAIAKHQEKKREAESEKVKKVTLTQ